MGLINPWMPETDQLRLAVFGKLLEELGELTAIVARCVIQGFEESEPVTGKPNRVALENEVADVQATITLMIDHFNLDMSRMHARAVEKMDDRERWYKMIENGRSKAQHG